MFCILVVDVTDLIVWTRAMWPLVIDDVRYSYKTCKHCIVVLIYDSAIAVFSLYVMLDLLFSIL